MAWFTQGNVRIYYEDIGKGEPIIANHGVTEDSGFWTDSGIAARLAERYRVIPYDMRGHSRTVVDGEPYGFDVETMAEDIDSLADELGLDRFRGLSKRINPAGGCIPVGKAEDLENLRTLNR